MSVFVLWLFHHLPYLHLTDCAYCPFAIGTAILSVRYFQVHKKKKKTLMAQTFCGKIHIDAKSP